MIDGKTKGKIPYEGKGLSSHPYALVLEQNKTQAMLLEALAKHGKTPEWSTTLESFKQDGNTVTCTLKHADDSLETVSTRYLVACDGSGSLVRRDLGLTFEGETYDSSFFLADVHMESSLGHDRLYLNLTKKGFFAFFPLYGDKQYRLIGSLNPEQTAKFEVGKGVGVKEKITSQDVEDHINQHSGLQVKILGSRWASVYRIHRRMTNKYRVGNVFLAGDAAHIHSPAGGQGMNTGIGDAFNLGWKLAAVINNKMKEDLLESYEEERLPVAKDVLNKADKLFELETTQNPILQQLKPLFMQTVSTLLSNVEAGKHWIFSFLSQIAVNYRDSAVVKNDVDVPKSSAGQAGDRLPFVELKDGTTTHQLSKGLGHHLFVIKTKGDALNQDNLEQVCSRYGVQTIVLKDETLLERKLSIKQTTLLLVRPDGYIAYRGSAQGLGFYLESLYLPVVQNIFSNETRSLEHGLR
ncbi:MAG: FAD-dependent monooxygenase, partial [Trueperaceae bacterium]